MITEIDPQGLLGTQSKFYKNHFTFFNQQIDKVEEFPAWRALERKEHVNYRISLTSFEPSYYFAEYKRHKLAHHICEETAKQLAEQLAEVNKRIQDTELAKRQIDSCQQGRSSFTPYPPRFGSSSHPFQQGRGKTPSPSSALPAEGAMSSPSTMMAASQTNPNGSGSRTRTFGPQTVPNMYASNGTEEAPDASTAMTDYMCAASVARTTQPSPAPPPIETTDVDSFLATAIPPRLAYTRLIPDIIQCPPLKHVPRSDDKLFS
ncbi:hypothetical protein IW261DRAFT_1574179 [Armillaria novae-zelandiae]|uniref:Uncharacterized protein n=1 Tax=Armillaria novae-zelandiae TaxID=153914 RepID=A0AA39NKU1_9AGAR|nr:hypothetical protein IW261DRAFT_1574179 [Armillaria novae-zelandiae]